MSFYNELLNYKSFDLDAFWKTIGENEIKRTLASENCRPLDFLSLLSPAAGNHLEDMAQLAHRLTVRNFGKVIFLYAPLYLSNYCVNQCTYCSFNIKNRIVRKKLTLEEVEKEAKIIAELGIRHILILTGESRKESSLAYIKDCVQILKTYFSSIAIEIYAISREEYGELIYAGVDSLTIYQEVYDEDAYDQLHMKGPKKDYLFRLDAPERACQAKMRAVNIGALLGLENWRKEAFLVGLHANYLQNKYIDTEISVSVPRIRPHLGAFQPKCLVDDKSFVQTLLALRIFLPRAGITVSTRESAQFRDNLIKLGVTKMSAGSSTEVGGYAAKGESQDQFEISDERSVEEVKTMIYQQGYQPVFKDWDIIS
jgi:2-iminoacetate synthase